MSSLAALELIGLELSPPFSPATLEYKATANLSVEDVFVAASPLSPHAAIEHYQINGDRKTPSHTTILPLKIGDDNLIAVAVSAESGDRSTYEIAVTRKGSFLNERNRSPPLPLPPLPNTV